jgi:hypothetical protein
MNKHSFLLYTIINWLVLIADIAVSALKEKGFRFQDAAYEGGDERETFVAKVKNIAGEEVVTVISPVKDDYGKIKVSIHSFNEQFIDEDTLRQRAEEIAAAISQNGVQIGNSKCLETGPDLAYRDIEMVKHRTVKAHSKSKEAKR